MKKSRDIINKNLIPDISRNTGRVTMSYRLGGTLASSYNSSDVYNFNVKEEGDIIVADPERSYLTTTLYPIAYQDAMVASLHNRVTGRFTDNLYASLGDAENYSTIKPTKISGLFKVALLQYQYNKTTANYREESLKIFPKTISGILRDVLKKYSFVDNGITDNIVTKATKLTLSMRSVLIKYEYYAPEPVKVYADKLSVSSSITLSGTFESFIPFDAENRIVAEVVPQHSEITDKASVTWSKTGSPIVQNSVAKEGDYALYLNGEGTSIKSQQSLEYVPSDNESLIIENWLKPDNITTSLLTRYGGTNLEKGLYYDFAQKINWVGNNKNNNTTAQAYVFDHTDASYFLSSSNVSALTFKTAANSSNGQTLELNVRLKNASTTSPVILLSNQSPTWQLSPTGKSAAIVYYGNSHSNASYAGKIAVITDNTTNVSEANGIFLLSNSKYEEDSILKIAIVTYGNYIRLFVNGKLEAYAILNAELNFSYQGSFINKSLWSTTPSDMFYRLYALRFTNFALYTSNYTTSSVYSPRAIPKIKNLGTDFKYPEGIACGVRYLANTSSIANDKTIIYASLSDGEHTYTAESTPIDPSKWNHIKMSIYKNTIVLYVNGVAYSSEIIPFDIELETISLGSASNTNSSQSFSGYIDNFKMYKDETFDLEGVKYVEMRPWLNGSANTAMEDFNPEIVWKSETTPSIISQTGSSSILGYMINCSINPKIYSEGLSIDTQNFGIRTYVYNNTSHAGTVFKKGSTKIEVDGTALKATLNGTVFIETAIALNTLYKIDVRYNRGKVKLSINDTDIGEEVETTINTTGTLYYGWDGSTSLYKGKLGPISIFDNNRNRIPALDMLISDYTTEAYYKNTVLSLTARDNVYEKDDVLFFDNGYSKVLNDITMTGSILNSTVESGFYIPKGSYFKIPSNENFVFGKDDFTIEFSVKTNVTDRRQVVIDRYFTGEGSWQVSINSDGNVYFTVTNNNASPYHYFLTTTSQTVNDGRWHKIFVIRQGAELSIYVDNKLADKFGMDGIFDFFASKDLYIAHQGSNNNIAYDFEGYLNNIRITKGAIVQNVEEGLEGVEEYNPTLYTSDAVTLRTFETTLLADTVTANEWISSGTSLSSTVALRSTNSLHIPSGSYQSTSGEGFILSKTKDFCIELSFYVNSYTGDSQSIFSRGTDLGSLSYNLALNPSLTALSLYCYHDGSGGNSTSISIPYFFLTERWYEIAVCCKNGEIYFIINGVYYKSSKQLSGDFYRGNSETSVFLGRLGPGSYSYYFDGYIENLKLTNGSAVYTKGFGEDASHLRNRVDGTAFGTNSIDSTVSTIDDHGVNPSILEPYRLIADSTIYKKGSKKVLSFGSTSYIKDSSGKLLTFGNKPFTILMDFMLTPSTGINKYLLQSNNTDKLTIDMYITDTGKVKVELKQNGELIKSMSSATTIPINKWVSLGLVRTAQNVLRLYLNGFTIATLNNVIEDIDCLGYPTYIGSENGSFTGFLDSLKVYEDHVVIPKAGDNIFYLNFNEDIATTSTVTDAENDYLKYQYQNVNFDYGIDGKYTASGYFNGLTSYVKLPQFPKLDFGNVDFDIEFEFFPTDGYNKYQTILSNSNTSKPFLIWMYGSSVDTVNNRIAIGTSYDNPIVMTSSTIHFEKWTTIRITRDNTLLRVYVNGSLDATTILTDHEFNMCSESSMYVGRNFTGLSETFFKGYLAYLRTSEGDVVRTINNSKFKVLSALDFENNQTDLVVYDYTLNMERLDRFRNTWSVIKYSTTTPEPVLQTITTSNEAVKLYRSGFICKNKHTHVSFNEFTIETRFMLTATSMPDVRRLIDQSGLYAINITTDKRIEFNGGSVVLRSDSNSIVVNKWHHVAVTRDSNKVTRLFLDGIKVGESSVVVNYSEVNHYPLCLGMYYGNYTHSSYVNYHFEGYMDNFYMVNGVCKYVNNFVPNIPSDTVISNTSLAFVNGTAFVDKNSEITWTASGFNPSSNKVKNKEKAMYSSSTSGYIQSTYNEKFKPGYKDFTLDFIISPLQILAATTLFDNRTDATLASGLTITQPTGNTASFTLSIGPTTGTTDWAVSLNTGINSIAAGNYYHLRVTRNLGKIYLFLNGTLKASADYTYEVPSSGVFVLGNRVNKNQGFTGYIEQFRYVDNTSLAGTTFATFTQELI